MKRYLLVLLLMVTIQPKVEAAAAAEPKYPKIMKGGVWLAVPYDIVSTPQYWSEFHARDRFMGPVLDAVRGFGDINLAWDNYVRAIEQGKVPVSSFILENDLRAAPIFEAQPSIIKRLQALHDRVEKFERERQMGA